MAESDNNVELIGSSEVEDPEEALLQDDWNPTRQKSFTSSELIEFMARNWG